MRKLITLYCFLTITSSFAFGQFWDSAGGVHGYLVYSLCTYNNDLYAGGADFGPASGIQVNNIAKWDGTKWSTVGSGITGAVNGSYGFVYSMCVYNGELYAAGQFNSAGGNTAMNIAMWNGSTWSSLGSGIQGSNSAVQALSVYNGMLYVGGSFDSAGGKPAKNIAIWNGSTWSSLSSNVNGAILSLCTYDSVIYAGGYFDSAGNIKANYIAQWNGVKWSPLSSGVTIANPNSGLYLNNTLVSITSIVLMKSKVYACGSFFNAGGTPANNIAEWNGSKWSALGSGINYGAYSLCAYNGILYAGGWFDTAGSTASYDIASWNGAKWDSIGMGMCGIDGIDSGVYAVAVYNGALYIGGYEGCVDNYSKQSNIAEWTQPLGINQISTSNLFSIYPNPSTGVFTFKMNNAQLAMDNKTTMCIYNISGQVVLNFPLSNLNSTFSIDLSNNPSGIYLYRVLTETGELVSSGKMVIQK